MVIDPINIGDALEVTVTRASNPSSQWLIVVLLAIIVLYIIARRGKNG